MSPFLSPQPGPVIQAWRAEGRRVELDGTERTITGTSFGSTEERARQNWVTVWGKGIEFPVAELTFTREGGAL